MHYYAIINEEYTVMEVVSSDTIINDDWYIEITEEQYNDEGFIGAFYDQDKNEFVGSAMWVGTTNEIRYDETYRTLTGKLNEIDEEIATHTHTGYVSSDDLQVLEDVVDTKADATHTHTEYAPVSHSHTEYATQVALDTLGEEVDGKANASHSHSNYAEVGHNHDTDYADISHTHTASEIGAATNGHNHDSDYADINHNHDNAYASAGHDHDTDYSAIDHSHSNYATVDSVSELSTTVSGKANASHTHDDRYYTEDEISSLLATKSDSTHNHTGVYDVSGAAASALSSANTYTDSKIDALVGEGASTTLDTIGEISAAIEDNQDMIDTLNSVIGNKANTTDLTSHTGNTTIHVTETEKNSWNAKSNFSGNYNDLTNKPSIPSINGLATETYVDEKVGGITVESIGALPDTTVIPTIPTNISSFTNDVGYLTEHQSLDGLATETYVDSQIDAIVIPDALSDLTADSTHRTVTDAEKSAWNAKSNFSGSYNDLTNKPTIPSIAGLATETYVDEAVSAKANSSHTHDDRYYTETEINTKLSTKSDSTHNHNSSYDALGAANTALASAKEYTDDAIVDEVTARDSAIATAKSSAISTASSDATTKANNALASAKSYTDTAVATAKNDLLNGAGSAYDTLKELGDLIDENVDAIEALETVAAGKANSSHTHTIANVTGLQSALDGKASTEHTHSDVYTETEINSLLSGKANTSHSHTIENITNLQSTLNSKAASNHTHSDIYTETEVDELLEGKANSSHTHTIANVSGLQSALDGKAATSHGTHVSYSTTAPVMDGSASVGTASTVARSDHKHPTDTSRAAKSDLDALTTTVNGKANSSHTHTIANITNLQSTLDGKAASGHTHGEATATAAGLMSASDKAKLNGIANGANAYTLPTASSTLGGVKTTSTVTSTSGYTACPIIGGVPYYKDTNTTYSLGSFGVTATATELNYVDGVTSNIQTQLNGKAASSHNHSGVYANASHSHTASAVGAVATTDVATVSEVETYLGI